MIFNNKEYAMKRFYFSRQSIFCCALFFLMAPLLFSAVSYAQTPEEELNTAAQLFEEGGKRLGSSDFNGAIQSWEAALSIYRKFEHKAGIGAMLGNLGLASRSLGDFSKAIEYHQKAAAIAKEIGDKQGEGIEFGNLGLAYKGLGDYQKATVYYEKALAIAEELGDKQTKGFWLGNLGSANVILGNDRKAIEYYEKALAVVEELGDKQNKGFWLSRLGLAYKLSGDFRKAIECHEKAAAIARELADKEGEETELASLALAYNGLGDNRKVIEYNKKALVLAEELGDKKHMAARFVDLGNASFDLGEFRKAIEYHEKALAITEELKDRRNKGVVLGSLGNVFVSMGDYRKAIDYFEKALAIAEELGDKQQRVLWVGNMGVACMRLGQYRKAIEHHEKALALAEEIGDKQSTCNQIGNLGNSYFSLGDYRKAIEYYEKALAIAGEIGDKHGKSSWLGNLGNCYDRLGDYIKSVDYNLKALAIAQEIGDKHSESSWLGNLGAAFDTSGYYQKAIEYYEKALAVTEETGDKHGKESWLGNLGVSYNSLGDYSKTIEYYEKAFAIAEEIGDRKGKSLWLGNLGSIYESLGDYRKAIEYHEKALAIAEEIEDKQGKGISLGSLGNTFYNSGDYPKSIEYYEKAMAIMGEIGDKTSVAILNGNLGEAYLALNRDEEAFSIFTKQDHPLRLGRYYLKKGNFNEAKKQFDRNREQYENAKDADFIIADWIGFGLSLEGLQHYEEGYTWYKKAIDFLEDQRNGLAPSEREQFFEGKKFGFKRIEAYEGAARCAFMLAKLDEAFYWAENTRGRILSELLSRKHSGESYKIPLKLAKEEEELATQIMMNKKQQQTAFHKNNPELLKQAEGEYPVLKQKMDTLIDRLRKDYPQYAAIKYPQPVKLSQLALKKEETIIEYEVTDPYTIGLVIRDGKVIKGFKVEKTRAELEGLIRKFRSPFKDDSDPSEFSLNLAKELTDLLIKPALPLLTKGEHLIIIPDESLSLLPFESLLLDAPQDVLKEEAVMLAQAKKLPESDTMDKGAIIRGLSKKPATRGGGLMVAARVSTQILFDTSSAQISKESRKQMEEILAALKSNELNNAQIRIEGHTDSIGNPGYNLKLSRRRAEAVYQYLKKGGIKENLLSFTGKGDTEPIADNATEQGRKQNRRVDFIRVLEKKDVKSAASVSRNLVYAIDEYPISYYQSASVLSLQRGLHTSRMKAPAFFGLGDPVFDTQDQRSAGMRAITIVAKKDKAATDITASEGTKEAGYRFSRLENTAKEVKEVGSLFSDSRVLIGPDASKNNLKKEDLTSRRYVLFSTHGILGNEIPYVRQPALVLNLVGNNKEDGFLTATEIFNMNLNADLVGLSACQTGLGIQSAGEGVVGLSRAFMYAGTDSVLVSLWSVSDESTYKLMVRFFEGLKQGKDKLTALKEAKNYLRKNGYDNPFYWAPFILIGEAH
jgi:tetratricopeptide (TPR) repeat protein